jgi:hypothetical protein
MCVLNFLWRVCGELPHFWYLSGNPSTYRGEQFGSAMILLLFSYGCCKILRGGGAFGAESVTFEAIGAGL